MPLPSLTSFLLHSLTPPSEYLLVLLLLLLLKVASKQLKKKEPRSTLGQERSRCFSKADNTNDENLLDIIYHEEKAEQEWPGDATPCPPGWLLLKQSQGITSNDEDIEKCEFLYTVGGNSK